MPKFPLFEEAVKRLPDPLDIVTLRKMDAALTTIVYSKIGKGSRINIAYGDKVVSRRDTMTRRSSQRKIDNGKLGFSSLQKELLATRPKPGICEVCKRSDVTICWDHDHITGNFRGWICSNCNFALGNARDSVKTLKALIEYLKRPREIVKVKTLVNGIEKKNRGRRWRKRQQQYSDV